MKIPKISIVMSVYNTEKYLRECIDSILSQSFSDFELIIVDDASTDNSREVIKSYTDARIQLIKNDHDYIGSLNKGISAARGQYIVRMDADDIMMKRRLQTQYQYMEENRDVDICCSWVKTFGRESSLIECPVKHNDIVAVMLFHNPIVHSSVILRTDKLLRTRNFPTIYNKKYNRAEDYKLWIDLAKEEFKFACIPEVLILYRKTRTQVTYKHEDKVIEMAGKIKYEYLQSVINLLIQKYPGFLECLSESVTAFNDAVISLESLKGMVYELYKKQLMQEKIIEP